MNINNYTVFASILDYKTISIIKKYFSISNKVEMSIGIYQKGETKISDDNLYYIGSLSKVFTSLLVLKIITEKIIGIHTNINDFLHLQEGDYPTIYQCLTHTSGSYFSSFFRYTFLNLLLGYSKKNLYQNITRENVIDTIKKMSRKKVKRGYYHYSDFNYAVLGILIEKIENRKFTDLLSDFIVNDLHLRNTFIFENKNSTKSVYHNKYINNWIWKENNPFITAGGIISNVEDLIKLANLVISSDLKYMKMASMICEESKQEKMKIVTTLSFHSYQKSNMLWHVGGIGTHRAMIIINSKRKLASVVLCNSNGVRKGNACYICKMIYGNLKRNKIKSVNGV